MYFQRVASPEWWDVVPTVGPYLTPCAVVASVTVDQDICPIQVYYCQYYSPGLINWYIFILLGSAGKLSMCLSAVSNSSLQSDQASSGNDAINIHYYPGTVHCISDIQQCEMFSCRNWYSQLLDVCNDHNSLHLHCFCRCQHLHFVVRTSLRIF